MNQKLGKCIQNFILKSDFEKLYSFSSYTGYSTVFAVQ